MSVKITEITDTEIKVNEKTLTKDMNGNWICQQELTPAEIKAFASHLEAVKRCAHPPSVQSINVNNVACTCETTVTFCQMCGHVLTEPETDC